MRLHEKNQKKKQSKASKKNVEMTKRRSGDKQTTVISLDPLSCLLNILLIYHLEVDCASPFMPDQAQLNCHSYTKNQLHVSIHF